MSKSVEALKRLSDDSQLQQFAAQYLRVISKRSLSTMSPDTLSDFLKERYDFFLKSYKKGRKSHFFQPDPNDSERWVFEQTSPDAAHILVTIQELIKTFDVKVRHVFHPVMSIQSSGKKILTFHDPEEGKENVSLIYIEFQDVFKPSMIKEMQQRIDLHMADVMKSEDDQVAMIEKLSEVKDHIKRNAKKPTPEQTEWMNLLDWIKENFSLFGYMEFKHDKSGKSVSPVKSTGLGILSPSLARNNNSVITTPLAKHVQRMQGDYRPNVFDVIPVISKIKLNINLMRVSIKVPASSGQMVEYNFVGLLKRSSLHTKNMDTPLIHLKMTHIFEGGHMLKGGYDYNEVVKFCTQTPKFELFRTPKQRLQSMVSDFLYIDNPNQVHCFQYDCPDMDAIPIMIVTPSSYFTRENIENILTHIKRKYQVDIEDALKCWGDEKARLHTYIKPKKGKKWTVSMEDLEDEISEIIQPWTIQFRQHLMSIMPRKEAVKLWEKYANYFPRYHITRRSLEQVAQDAIYLEKMLKEGKPQFNLIPFNFAESVISGKASLLILYVKEKNDLVSVLPILQNLGIHVYDEMTTRIGETNNILGYIHAYRIVNHRKEKIDEDAYREVLLELIENIYAGNTGNDALNALALEANINWRMINMLQTYRNLYAQIGAPYSRTRISSALHRQPDCVQLMVRYFDTKFNPDSSYGTLDHRTSKALPAIKQEFLEALQSVSDVSEDIILKRLFNLMEHTLRTNFYIQKPVGTQFISIKVDSGNITQMPAPTPYREIYVHDVGVEGVHLRFGPVARGGLRWSDRRKDFRKEVLGLVKTQQTKNVVIVPEGSKGGFYVKRHFESRDDMVLEAEYQYRLFINGLLDITDNITQSGKVTHPKHVLCYDGQDPYLVVAADKGTAQFSDFANEESLKRGFWLGDAFASGGSNGYNHKEVAITARGGWECVKLHFLEQGKDIQKEPFTVAAIGDMSGDVFGNGMLLSRCIKLVAAFNHMHIFLDPNPDPEKSWKERERLFNMSRSSWEDYNTKLISKGGGVFSRKAKAVPLSKEVKTLLGVTQDELTGEQVIKAILKMQVELLWFGGIGTYIKSSQQRHVDVADPANDGVRIDSKECRAKVIGEGANLGVTQEARVEASIQGIRLNTDFIDNSAGVNMSDYEVNIKILLKRLMDEKKIKTMSARNTLLRHETDNISELVLANNVAQHQLISLDGLRSKAEFHVFIELMQMMQINGVINMQEEGIPPRAVLDTVGNAKKALPRPIIAVLQSHVKMMVYKDILNSDLVANPFFDEVYKDYYPEKIKKDHEKDLLNHHLKKEILGTLLTNRCVNQAGTTFFNEIVQITGLPIHRIAQVYLLLDHCFDGQEFRAAIHNSGVPKEQQYQALLEFEELLEHLTIDLLQLPQVDLSFERVKEFEDVIHTIRQELVDEKLSTKEYKKWTDLGFSGSLSRFLSVLPGFLKVPDVVYLKQKGVGINQHVLRLLLSIDKWFSLDWLKQRVMGIDVSNQWETNHKEMLLQTLHLQRIRLVEDSVKAYTTSQLSTLKQETLMTHLEALYGDQIKSYFDTLESMKTSGTFGLSQLTVTIHKLLFIK